MIAVTCARCGKQFQADPTEQTVRAGEKRDDGTRPLEYRFTCPYCHKLTAAPPSRPTVERSDPPGAAT